jgi:hypothetical protein
MTPFEKWWKRYVKNNYDSYSIKPTTCEKSAAEAAWEACAKKSLRLINKHFNKITHDAIAKAMRRC